MALVLLQAELTLMEHTYFASREVGNLYESEPLIGNYALTYALNLCAAPYKHSPAPRYKEDLLPLNQRGIYVTPATFHAETLRYAFCQFNAQSDSYYFRFDQNAIATDTRKARAANFPQAGKIRMLGAESRATFYLLAQEQVPFLPGYIRLGKFQSKARVEWQELRLINPQPQEDEQDITLFLNAVDLPPEHLSRLRAFSLYNIPPAPLLRRCHLNGPFWHARTAQNTDVYLPAGMRYGVEAL